MPELHCRSRVLRFLVGTTASSLLRSKMLYPPSTARCLATLDTGEYQHKSARMHDSDSFVACTKVRHHAAQHALDSVLLCTLRSWWLPALEYPNLVRTDTAAASPSVTLQCLLVVSRPLSALAGPPIIVTCTCHQVGRTGYF